MNQKEFEIAYKSGHRRTINFLLSCGLPEDDAMETSQAAWVRGLEKLNQVRDSDRAVHWVNAIALNLYRNQVRRDSKLAELPEMPVDPKFNLAAVDVRTMLEQCNNSDRELLEHRYLEDRGIEELSKEYGCSRTAVRVRLVRARKRLREEFARSVTN